MKVILSSNPYRDKGLRAAQEARKILEKEGVETVLCLPFTPRKGERVEIPQGVVMSTLEKELPQADMLVCFGGDGTILHAARDATMHGVPILGVNLGSVGFMAELERTELSSLHLLGKGVYTTEERMMLDIRVMRGGKLISENLALNDAVISNGSMARVAELEVLANGDLVTEVTGDGVIIATPTGSTAYSLSAGGPVVEPVAQTMIVCPICIHNMRFSSYVLSPEHTLSIELERNGRKPVYLFVDESRAFALRSDDQVLVRKSKYVTKLVRLSEKSFCEIFAQKMLPGGFHE